MLLLCIGYPRGYEEEEDEICSFFQKLMVQIPMVVQVHMLVQAPMVVQVPVPPLTLLTAPLIQECCITVLDNINVYYICENA